jgi:pimeloyl-ACP methyl ester carboxylesterase
VRNRLIALVVLALGASCPALVAEQTSAAPPKVHVANNCVRSAPEPGTKAGVRICYSLFRPAGASARRPVPLLMHSHGWGGSRSTDPSDVREFLDAGYGVLSFDQRGWGESGGYAHVENPNFEGKDVRRLVRLISNLGWVRQDGPGDPRLGAVGGSYGGGYQFLGAFESLRVRGKPVFDAIAPEITWHDLSQSIAPEGVVRTEWALGLSAASLVSDALPHNVYKALVEGAATGEWPDGSLPLGENMVKFFARNGPKWHVDHGRRLDIPVLFGQGTTDTLFPLQQGLANWRKALTPRARKHSIFVGYNGGHVLPALLPAGVRVTSDPCSKKLAGGDFRDLSLRFFDETLRHRDTGLGGWGRLHLATPGSTCTTVRSVAPTKEYAVGPVATTTAVGAPLPYEVATGPLRVAGSPYLTGKVTALGVQNRAFYGLAVGTSPLTAKLVQNNVLPLNEPTPVTGKQRRIALPSVAVNVPKGQKLFLVASAISDTFALMGARVPGVVRLDDTMVHLPVVRR